MLNLKDITSSNSTDYLNHIYLKEWAEILQFAIAERGRWIRILFQVGMVFVFVAGLCGNLLTCVVIYCHRSMHTATNYYLFNLAVSDLLVAPGILIDLNGYSSYPYNILEPDFGNVVCKIYFFLVGALWNNSVLIITALAIERYIAVWHPLLLQKEHERRRVTRNICIIWAIAIVETVPEIFTVNLIQSQRFFVCFIVPSPFAKLLNGILGVVTFMIPLGIITLMYTMVAFKVNVNQTSYDDYSGSQIFNHRNSSSKVNKVIMALTVSFIVCWLPFCAMRTIIYTMEVPRRSWILQNWDLLLMLTSFNSWFSIILNPLLNSLISTKFRIALKALWTIV